MAAPLLPRVALVLAAALTSRAAFAEDAAPAAPLAVTIDAQAAPEKPPAEAAPATQLPPPSSTVPGKYVAVGSLAVGAGVIFFVSALFDSFATSAHTDATTLAQQRACGAGPSCSAFTDKHDDAARDGTISGVLAGVGGVVAVGAVAAWIFWPDDDDNDVSHDPSHDTRQDDKSSGKSASARSSSPSSPWFAPSVGPHGASLTAGVRF